MATDPELARKQGENEIKRSRVRQCVTYAVIWAYLLLATVVTLWLMWAGRYEVAIGVLAGVAGLAGSITGFWFGSRRASPAAAQAQPPRTSTRGRRRRMSLLPMLQIRMNCCSGPARGPPPPLRVSRPRFVPGRGPDPSRNALPSPILGKKVAAQAFFDLI